jgi:putative membrane protein
MALLQEARDTGTGQTPAPPKVAAATGKRIPQTRIGAAWVGICAATAVLIMLIVFMLQNTRPVEVSFFGLHGSLPLALALLIATVGGILTATVLGTARITQLRRLARTRRS